MEPLRIHAELFRPSPKDGQDLPEGFHALAFVAYRSETGALDPEAVLADCVAAMPQRPDDAALSFAIGCFFEGVKMTLRALGATEDPILTFTDRTAIPSGDDAEADTSPATGTP